jgi:two-component system, chemotaxis family, chemotaxis protein CheY
MVKVLIVDDSSLSRKILSSILKPEGHEIIEATNGFMALELYVLERPDVVLMDIAMPDLQGPEVLIKLREIDPEAQVIMASADAQDMTRISVEKSGAVGYITKPFNKTSVLETFNRVINNQ